MVTWHIGNVNKSRNLSLRLVLIKELFGNFSMKNPYGPRTNCSAYKKINQAQKLKYWKIGKYQKSSNLQLLLDGGSNYTGIFSRKFDSPYY